MPRKAEAPSTRNVLLERSRGLGLLTAEEEVELAKTIEEANRAEQELKRDDLSPAARTKLRRQVRRGEDAREEFLLKNVRLVQNIVQRYRDKGLDEDDLFSEGILGLKRAVEKFDWRKGFKFSTYATWWVRQAMQRALADQGRTIRLPVHMRDKLNSLGAAQELLFQELGREPNIEEIADNVDMPLEQVTQLLLDQQDIVSLEQPIGSDDGSALFLGDILSAVGLNPEELMLDNEQRELLLDAVEQIPLRHKNGQRIADVLMYRFGLEDGIPRTLDVIGEWMGVTRERIRQLETIGLELLRSILQKGQTQERTEDDLEDAPKWKKRKETEAPAVCAMPECGAALSRYNPGNLCNAHTGTQRFRVRGTDEPID